MHMRTSNGFPTTFYPQHKHDIKVKLVNLQIPMEQSLSPEKKQTGSISIICFLYFVHGSRIGLMFSTRFVHHLSNLTAYTERTKSEITSVSLFQRKIFSVQYQFIINLWCVW